MSCHMPLDDNDGMHARPQAQLAVGSVQAVLEITLSARASERERAVDGLARAEGEGAIGWPHTHT
jgi:phosphotransferase system HPr-like phosphotransfer protein